MLVAHTCLLVYYASELRKRIYWKFSPETHRMSILSASNFFGSKLFCHQIFLSVQIIVASIIFGVKFLSRKYAVLAPGSPKKEHFWRGYHEKEIFLIGKVFINYFFARINSDCQIDLSGQMNLILQNALIFASRSRKENFTLLKYFLKFIDSKLIAHV